MIHSSTSGSQAFYSIPEVPANQKAELQDITQSIQQCREMDSWIPASYKAHVLIRLLIIGGLIAGIAISIMALQGSLTTFPEHFIHFVHTLNWTHVSIGAGILTVLLAGTAFVIYKSYQTKDRITKRSLGKIRGDNHWESAIYLNNDRASPGYIDTSTLDASKSGTAFMYAYKDAQNHYSVSLAVLCLTPAHMVLAIVYNVLRVAVIPFYILGCMLFEKASRMAIFPTDRRFRLTDIPKEIGKTILRICKAPFYTLAIMFAALYSLIDPLNGRKLGACLELQWNEGVTRAEGFWSIRGPQTVWKYEGGRNPSGLGKNGGYLAGCWQPIAVIHYQDGEIIFASSLTYAVKPNKGKIYTIFTHALLARKHNTLVLNLQSAIA